MVAQYQPPPTWANPVLTEMDPATGQATARFNPQWLQWFIELTALLTNSGAGGGSPSGGTGTIGGNVYILSTDQPPTPNNLAVFKSYANPNITLVDDSNIPADNLKFLFADRETPSGVIDGVNDTFTLAHDPDPVESLVIYSSALVPGLNGLDFVVSGGNVVTYTVPPGAGTWIRAFYRYAL